jgi:RHS repeat-associated protein
MFDRNHIQLSYCYGFNGMEKDDEHTQGKYDFGARIYDARLGRWLAVDPKYYKNPGESPFKAMYNCPIRFVDIFGEIELDPMVVKTYPKAALLLQNVDKLYRKEFDKLPEDLKKAMTGVDMSKVITDKFQQSFKVNSTLSDDQITSMLTNGEGAFVSSYDLDYVDDEGKQHLVNGKNHTEILKGNVVNIDAQSDNDKVDGFVVLDDDLLGALEKALGGTADGYGLESMDDDDDATLAVKAAVSTLFHEFTHYGRNKTGAGNSATGPDAKEYGKEFEKEAYGEDVGRYMNTESTLNTAEVIEEE